jgi:sugar/nucleoside kinase (ribokinase family)
MSDVWTMGELLVEVMRPRADMGLDRPGTFLGPFPSGAPGIFIDTVARLGHSAAIISGVGEDDFGRCLLERLRRDGVATEFVQVFPGSSTGVAFVTYFRDGSRRFIFHWDGTPAVMAQVPDRARIGKPRFFHLMGCSLMANDSFRDRLLQAVQLFADAGAQVSFDPNIRFELLGNRTVEQIAGPALRRCTILFPGEKELQLLSGVEDADGAALAMMERYPLEAIVLKRGRRGCSVYGRGSAAAAVPAGLGSVPGRPGLLRGDIPAFEVREVDPTGAGDCFDAGFLCGRLEGRSLAESARLAAAVGALNAQAFGPMEGRITPKSVARLVGRRVDR